MVGARKYIKPTHTKNDPREDVKIGGRMMWVTTCGTWASSIGDKYHSTELD